MCPPNLRGFLAESHGHTVEQTPAPPSRNPGIMISPVNTNKQMVSLHLLKNICYCPLLGLKGIHHYWIFFSWGHPQTVSSTHRVHAHLLFGTSGVRRTALCKPMVARWTSLCRHSTPLGRFCFFRKFITDIWLWVKTNGAILR